MNNINVYVSKHFSKWAYIWRGRIYGGQRFIFGVLIGFHIWGHIFEGILYAGDLLTGFLRYRVWWYPGL